MFNHASSLCAWRIIYFIAGEISVDFKENTRAQSQRKCAVLTVAAFHFERLAKYAERSLTQLTSRYSGTVCSSEGTCSTYCCVTHVGYKVEELRGRGGVRGQGEVVFKGWWVGVG